MKEIVRPIALASGVEGDVVFGRMFIARFASALKLSLIHQSSNDAVKKPIEELWHSIAHGRDLWVKLTQERFFINGEFVQLNYNTLPHAEELKGIFDKCDLSEIHFEANMKLQTLRSFFDQFQKSMRTGTPENFNEMKIPGVTLIPRENMPAFTRNGIKSETVYEKIIDTYARLCVGVEFMSSQLQVSENPHYAILSSELQRLWGYAEEDRDFVVGIKGGGGRVSHYVTNVAVLTLLMAQSSVSRGIALHLAVQALTQDLGRLVMPDLSDAKNIFQTDQLVRALKKVPLSTLKTILARGADATSTHRLACALRPGRRIYKRDVPGVVS